MIFVAAITFGLALGAPSWFYFVVGGLAVVAALFEDG